MNMIHHIVLFQTVDDDALSALLEREFFNLKDMLPEIQSMSGGNNTSKEGFSKGFNKCYVLRFEDEDDLQKYLLSDAHKYFVATYVSKTVKDVLVFDYVCNA